MKFPSVAMMFLLFIVSFTVTAEPKSSTGLEQIADGEEVEDWHRVDIQNQDQIIFYLNPSHEEGWYISLVQRELLYKLLSDLVRKKWLRHIVLDSVPISSFQETQLDVINLSQRTYANARRCEKLLQGDRFLLRETVHMLFRGGVDFRAGKHEEWAKSLLPEEQKEWIGLSLLRAMGSVKHDDFVRLYANETVWQKRLSQIAAVLGDKAYQGVLLDAKAVHLSDRIDLYDRIMNSHFEIPEAMAWQAKNTGTVVVSSRSSYAHKQKGIVPYLRNLNPDSAQTVVMITTDGMASQDAEDGSDIILKVVEQPPVQKHN